MRWEKKPLKAIADCSLGKMLDQKKNEGDLMPYLANLNVRWGSFDFDNLRQMRFKPDELERYRLKNGDIVMCEGGEPGRCALWKGQKPNMVIQKALHRIRAHECMNSEYLFYYLLHQGKTKRLTAFASGTTIQHLSLEKLIKIEVETPPLEVQNRIAAILSPYDSLIENNRQRIKLLEKAARLIYQEWFIRLRFPGYENTEIVDGVPAGWNLKHLSEIFSTQYGYTETASDKPIGPKFLRGTDINKTSYIDWSTVPFCSDGNLDFDRYSLQVGDIVVIRMADPGKVAIVETAQKAIFASYLVRLKQKPSIGIPPLYLFYALANGDYSGFISRASGGTTRKSANVRLLLSFEILLPPKNLAELFVKTVYPMRQQIQTLLRQNGVLRQTRNLLLPKLIKGELID